VPDDQLIDQLVEAAKRLIAENDRGIVDGDDVARAIGRDPEADGLYDAFCVIEQRGVLKLDAWGGGMGLPHGVQLP
jgi:hypothetical protein